MINNSSLQVWKRLESKRMDQLFVNEIQEGLNCSRFESEAILQKVHQTYELLFEGHDVLKPGQIRLVITSVEAGAGQSLREAPQVLATLTLDDSEADMEIRKNHGIAALRQHRMIRMSTEAVQQGGLLTLEDLAYRLFNCGIRTLCRDLEYLRSKGIAVALRSTVKDMGRTLSHRKQIVQQWLNGKEYSEISKATHHSVASVHNYIGKFRRVALLETQLLAKETIAFLVGISIPLVCEYLALLNNAEGTFHRLEELKGDTLKKTLSAEGGTTRD